MRTLLAAAALFALVVAWELPDQPAPLDAAPVNATPANPSGNEAAMRAEIERLTAALAEAQQSLADASVVAPNPAVPASVVLITNDRAAGDCANGNCAVPRARVQYVRQPAEWKQEPPRFERKRGGRDGRILTPFK